MIDVLGMLGTATTGGVLGLVGAGVGKAFDHFNAKQQAKEAEAEREHEVRLLQLQRSTAQSDASIEHQAAVLRAETELLHASYDHDASAGSASQWVINLLRLVRPVLTLILIICTCVVAWRLESFIDHQRMINELLAMAAMSVSWWFGSRHNPR